MQSCAFIQTGDAPAHDDLRPGDATVVPGDQMGQINFRCRCMTWTVSCIVSSLNTYIECMVVRLQLNFISEASPGITLIIDVPIALLTCHCLAPPFGPFDYMSMVRLGRRTYLGLLRRRLRLRGRLPRIICDFIYMLLSCNYTCNIPHHSCVCACVQCI